MKNILLLAHDDDGQVARFQAALDLVRALDGHLNCIDVTPTPVYGGNKYAGLGSSILLSDERESEAENKARLTERLVHEDISWSWEDATGDIADCVTGHAMLADLIVLNRELDDYPLPDMRTIASRVAMQAGKPIVAVPQSARDFRATGRALIAWDGQEAVAAAMRACTPLLRLASEVCIFTTGNGAEKAEPAEAAAYLSRHDIHATIKIVDDGLHHADDAIAQHARQFHADYIVMGAYNHGRMREAFGGVTKRMLTHSKLPLVIAH